MNNLLKNWMITSIYLYLFFLLGHLELPIENTNIPFVMNTIYLNLFLFAFILATLLQLWRSFLPQLNQYYGFTLWCLSILFLMGWMCLMPFEPLFHLAIFLAILAWQLIQYRLYNKPLQKKVTIKEKKKIDKIWIILGFFFIFVIYFGMFNTQSEDQVRHYLNAYPTKEELEETYDTNILNSEIVTNVSTNNRADNNYANYYFDDYYIKTISSSMSVKGYSKTFNNYRHYIWLEEISKQEYISLESGYDDLVLYIHTEDTFDTLESNTPTGTFTTAFAIYEDVNMKVYFNITFQQNIQLNDAQFISDINLLVDYLRNFE